ncbi:MAG: glycoside hydrolase family 13 protein [Bacteroidales bacterium]
MKKILATLLSITTTIPLFSLNVERVDPPNWWAGMKNSELQIMITGQDVGVSDIKIEGEGIKVNSKVSLENKDYAILYLDLKDAKPGEFKINLKKGSKSKVINYELKDRTILPEDRMGFGPQDVLYLIMPDRFANGDVSNDNLKLNFDVKVDRANPSGRHGGDLRGIINHLNYINDLGVTAIWLNPVLENDQPSGDYHGYATTDYYRVDPRFGSNDEYVELIDKTHDMGMKLVMDMIFNHCGSEHQWRKNPPSHNWFNNQDKFVQTSFRLSSHYDPYTSDYDKGITEDGWFVESMPDLNQRNPHVARYLIQNSIWWIEYSNIDGIRMDTHPYADFDMMSQWCKEVMDEYPNYNIVGECWYGNTASTAFWQANSKLSAPRNSNLKTVMDFPLMSVLNKSFNEETTPWNGLNTIYDQLSLDYLYQDPNYVLTFLDNHDTDRFLTEMPDNIEIFKQAITFLLTTRGIPQIYYGTEILMNGTKSRSDGDIRLDFPGGWSGDPINSFTKEGRSDLQNQAHSFLTKILNWRKGNKTVTEGVLKHFMPTNSIYAYTRTVDDKSVFVILNGKNQEVEMDINRYSEALKGYSRGYDIVTGDVIDITNNIKLPSRAALILELQR